MANDFRTSTGTFDARGSSSTNHSIVEQTTDIFNRLRNSLIRNRKERLLEEDVQATENALSQLHFTQLMAKETLTKLMTQGNSMHRSYSLINQLQRDIKDIAEDLNKVNDKGCFGTRANGSCFAFTCFGCLGKKQNHRMTIYQRQSYAHRMSNKDKIYPDFKNIERNSNLVNQTLWGSAAEREETISRTRALARQRREHPDFIHTMNVLKGIQRREEEANDHKLNKTRNILFQSHSLVHGYIDQPELLINEIDLVVHFDQLTTYLDQLLKLTETMTNEVNKHNVAINKIEAQAMQSGALLTDYTVLGHNILGSSPAAVPEIANKTQNLANYDTLGIKTGQKALFNSLL